MPFLSLNEIALNGNAVLETAAIGTEVGRISISNHDGEALSVSLIDAFGDTDLNGAFQLIYDPIAHDYRLVVRDRSKIDYETVGASLKIRVKVADGTQAVFKDFTVKITDVNEAPTDLFINHRSVDEHAAAGTWVADLSGLDPDAGDVLSYAIKDAATSPFAIVKNASGVYQLVVRDGSLIDYASDPDKKIDVTIRAIDKDGLFVEKTFALDIARANHAPTDIIISDNGVYENSATGTLIGYLQGVDSDPGDTLTYTLLDDAGGRFYLDTTGGVAALRVKDGHKLDFELQSDHDIRVLVTDKAGATFEQTFTIAILDVLGEWVVGTAADEIIYGNYGDDHLDGGAGADTLWGGFGADTLIGGSGKDVFQFKWSARPSDADLIVDFTKGEDKVHLSKNVFKKLGPVGALAGEKFYVGEEAVTADQNIVYNRLTGQLFYDHDGNGTSFAKQLIATFANKPLLSASDFVVISEY